MNVFVRPLQRAVIVVLLGVIPGAHALAGEPLASRAQAERLALELDAGRQQLEARQAAYLARAVSAGQLPDPELRLGALNLPVDSFELDQEPMTQLLVGVRQAFPPGRSRSLSSAANESLAEVQGALAQERERYVRREVGLLWVGYEEAQLGAEILARKLAWYAELEQAISAGYASGSRRQHEVIRARLEQQVLAQRLVRIHGDAGAAAAGLERWCGLRPAAALSPTWQSRRGMTYAEALAAVERHPLLLAEDHRVELGAVGEDLARERYKPSVGVDVSYGFRSGEDVQGDGRPDFFSAMLSFSMPVFTGKRQDRELAAARADLRSARQSRDERYRVLKGELDRVWERLEELMRRVALFASEVVPEAERNVEATLTAYQNRLVSFEELVRAQEVLLGQELEHTRVRAELERRRIHLAYLAGEGAP